MAEPRPLLLLDGATGTELARRGVDTHGPAWSAPAIVRAPGVLAAVHEEHARAGADVITTNTFRTQRRTLARIGEGRRAREWTAAAVRIAREAADKVVAEGAGRPLIRVAGSVAPLEDSYTPDLAPDEATALVEHREHVGHLADAGVDLLLVETMTTVAESRVATRAAAETGLETWTSVTTDVSGERLISGEPLDAWVEAVAPLRPAAVLVNCLAPESARVAVGRLAPLADALGALPGAYANLGSAEPLPGGVFDIAMAPDAFAESARGLLDAGARILGGCCGTTPEHTRALRALLDERMAAERTEREGADVAWGELVARAAAMAGGGRALVVGVRDGRGDSDQPAGFDVVRPPPAELTRLPRSSFRLALVDGDPDMVRRAAEGLEPGGWLAARLPADARTRAPLGLADLEMREVTTAGDTTLILARRPG